MFHQFAICIFSYNRPQHLLNLFESARQFYPEMSVAIFDDASTDPAVKAILEEMKQNKIHVQIADKERLESKHGGLYHNMNEALKYVCEKGFRYAYFVQDDMQFLWRDEALESRLGTLFEMKDCIMCNFNFFQKILRDGLHIRLPKITERIYTYKGRGVMDTGIIDLQKAKVAKLHFPYKSERENAEYWHSKGFNFIWMSIPHLAWVPMPDIYRYKKRAKRTVRTLKPLNKEAIDRLLASDNYIFLEDYTSTRSFLLKPYWHEASPGLINLLKIYIKYYLGFPSKKN